jgi:hypothetical protein
VERFREAVAEFMCRVAIMNTFNPGSGRALGYGVLMLLWIVLIIVMLALGFVVKFVCWCVGLPT